ncbi:hypothetical protein FIBSPDRAFT_904020 [Athelia psychrophila]|uniref:Uncharacterized protein n=1 Tax=Athelia psychrophila TaxID=1759441 RepID=A0A167V996_9AGAM|nr:hypothetical protein FIBSPDRAFT_904020 [Fibularhizoctonia sp. CBS 109695]
MADMQALPDGVEVTSDLAILMATAMALELGAARSRVHQYTRMLYTPDGTIRSTRTDITFAFFDPINDSHGSPYTPPYTMTLDEATRALVSGRLPFNDGAASPVYTTPSPTPCSSPITICSSLEDAEDEDRGQQCPEYHPEVPFDQPADMPVDEHLPVNVNVDVSERWYMVTRGLGVGPVQGLAKLLAVVHGVSGAFAERYNSQEEAEQAFDDVLKANSVLVL